MVIQSDFPVATVMRELDGVQIVEDDPMLFRDQATTRKLPQLLWQHRGRMPCARSVQCYLSIMALRLPWAIADWEQGYGQWVSHLTFPCPRLLLLLMMSKLRYHASTAQLDMMRHRVLINYSCYIPSMVMVFCAQCVQVWPIDLMEASNVCSICCLRTS
jgi:hypothetical protein